MYVLDDLPPPDEENDEEEPFERVTDDYLHRETWRLAMRAYIAVAEKCKPMGSYRRVRETTGLHQHQQKVFRDLLVRDGLARNDEGGFYWTSTKLDRRIWAAQCLYPAERPPLARSPLENPPALPRPLPEGVEGV